MVRKGPGGGGGRVGGGERVGGGGSTPFSVLFFVHVTGIYKKIVTP